MILSLPRIVLCRLICVLSLAFASATVFAQKTEPSTITGRVHDARFEDNMRFIENARVLHVESGREVTTDRDGRYRLDNVTGDTGTVRVTYTGLDPKTETVSLLPGRTTSLDIGLNATREVRRGEEVLVMPVYSVSDGGEMPNSLIALNAERHSPKLKRVLGTDEYGVRSSDDMGELLKYMPGLTMLMQDGEPAAANIDGVGQANVPVTVGGFTLSSAGQNSTTRETRLTHLSLNNFSRIELVRSPTPASPGNALAGTINLVPRSAFERRKAVLNFTTYLTSRVDEVGNWKKMPGSRFDSWRILPGFDFSYIVPVNDRFGFSVSGNLSETHKRRDFVQNTWRGTQSTTNGTSLPHTTAENPYISAFQVKDGELFAKRKALAATADWRVTERDTLSFSTSYSLRRSEYDNRTLTYTINNVLPGGFSNRYTRSTASTGTLGISTESRNYDNATFMTSLLWQHAGETWQIDGGLAFAQSEAHDHAPDEGFVTGTVLNRSGLVINFDDVSELGPRTISVRDGTGAVVDPFDINTYALTEVSMSELTGRDYKRTGYVDLNRDFEGLPFALNLQMGARVEESKRDMLLYNNDNSYVMAFRGADGVGSTTPAGDDDAAPYFWGEIAGRRGAFGYPSVPVVNIYKMFQLTQSNPGYFSENAITRYDRITNASRVAVERISAAYGQLDGKFFDHRLRIITGVRVEETDISGSAALADPTANFQRDASGNVILSGGNPVLIHPAGSLEARLLTLQRRAAHVRKDFRHYFPSINAIYKITENLQLSGAYFTSIGRPAFSQYAGGVTVPNFEAAPSAANRYTLSNVGIKPWTAETFALSLDYYFQRSGKLSISAFRRDIKNFFGNIVTPATAEFLESYGLPSTGDALDYDVSTQYNLDGTARMEGVTVSYKQSLAFLPHWARGVSVFANLSKQRNAGDHADEFALIPYYGSGGVGIVRNRWTANLNYTWRDDQFQETLAAASGRVETTFDVMGYGSLDLSATFKLSKHYSAFFKVTNLLDEDHKLRYYNPATPEHARLRTFNNYGGGIVTIGIQGSY